jgi:type I restriction enzyme R subunit
LKDLSTILYRQNLCFTITNLWEAYHIIYPEKVRVLIGNERQALTSIIQLVRFAFKHIAELESLYQSGAKYFALWSGQLQRALTDEQIQIMRHVQDYILANGFAQMSDIVEYDESLAANLIKIFKVKEEREESLLSLSNFLIYHRGIAA